MIVLLSAAFATTFVETTSGYAASAWTPAEGMPSDQATQLVQTADGAVWVATFDGLVRLLGGQVDVIGPAEGLRDRRVVDLGLDPEGRLWLVSEHGLLARWTGDHVEVVDVGDGKLTRLERTGGDLWAMGGEQLIRIAGGSAAPWPVPGLAPLPHEIYDLPDKSHLVLASEVAFHVTAAGAREVHRPARHAQVDEAGAAWLAHGHDLWTWRPGGAPEPVDAGLSEQVCALRPSARGVRVATWGGTWREVSGEAVGPPLRGDLCGTDLTDPQGHLWYFEDGWLVRDGARAAHTGPIASLLALGPDDLLVATEALGVVRVRPAQVHHPGRDTPLVHTPVYTVAADGDAVWTTSRYFDVFRIDDAGVHTGRVDMGPRAGTSEVLVTSLHIPAPGEAQVGSMLGLCTLRADLGRCELMDPAEVDHSFVDLLGRTSISKAPGLVVRVPGEPERAWPLAVHKLGGHTGPRPLVWYAGSLWFGDLLGHLHRLTAAGDEQVRLGTGKLRHIGPADDGSLWVAPEGQGICRVRAAPHADPRALPPPGSLAALPLDAQVQCLGTERGLHDDLVHAIVDDGLGRTWYSTNHGIAWVHTEALHAALDGELDDVQPTVLGRTDGMLDEECNGGDPPSAARTPDGRLWFATMRGLALIDPRAVPDPPPPEVRWTRLQAGSTTLRPRPWSDASALAADERRARVSWAAATFDQPEQLRWRYRLEGRDDHWSETTTTAVEYADLPAGALQLVVQAGRSGRWGPEARLAIERQPTFQETVAFPMLVGLGGAAALGLWSWSRLRAARVRQRQLSAEVDRQTVALRQQNEQLHAQTALLAERAAEISSQAERLRQQDELRTRFVANLSHELRTPLTLVTGPARALHAVAGLPAEAQTAADVISRNAARLDELVDQLLDVARLEAGELPLRVRPIDLGAFVGRVVDRFSPSAQARAIQLTVNAEPAPVFFDADKIDKVVSNLLSNALKFTAAGGRVEVRVSAASEDRPARVEVVDDGIGIEPAAQARLFERFFQAEQGDARQFQGAGIGLNLAMELVQLHGGDIGVSSEPGRGSRFWFTLPGGAAHIAAEEVDLQPAEAAAAPLPLPAGVDGGASVLVVEDHPDMRAWIVTHLAAHFRVRTASDGLAALAAVAAERPDLILSDVMMPGMDGITLSRRLRADGVDVPIVLLSAKSAESDRVEALRAADDYLTKPFFPGELVLRLQRLLPLRSPLPAAPAGPEHERAWLDRLRQEVDQRMAETDLSIEALARVMALSRRQLHREVTRLTGLSPTDYLQQVRLDTARGLLERGAYATVGEVAAVVGLSPNYLGRLYRARWGCSPSEQMAKGTQHRSS